MLLWLRFVGPGVALLFIGALLATVPASKEIGGLVAGAGVVYLFIAGPIYKRRWRIERRAKDYYLLQRAKRKYQ